MSTMSYKYVKTWRINTKRRLVEAFGSRCAKCGLVDSHCVYDFHHVDPNEKDFCLAQQINSWDRITEEAAKCMMLCVICHRKFHSGEISLPDKWQEFDERLIVTSTDEVRDACPVCGSMKPKAQITCSKTCGAKRQRKVAWDRFDLRDLYQKEGTFVGVARVVGGVSDVAVKKRMRKLGLLDGAV